MVNDNSKYDSKEFELPETTFTQDIDNKIFQTIVVQTLLKIEGITLLEETGFIDSLLRRATTDHLNGIHIEQDEKSHSINIRMELNILYGVSIPQKAEEIHTNLAKELTKLTGLHINNIHVVFKNVILPETNPKGNDKNGDAPVYLGGHVDEEYTEEF